MLRISMRRNTKLGTGLLLGALLVTVYLYKDYSDHQVILQDVEKSVITEAGLTRPPIINNSATYSWPKCQRNTSVVNHANFTSFTENFQNFLYYQHCRHFPMLLDIPDKCGGADQSSGVFLLLVIKSSPGNYDRRAVLRKTWAAERKHNGLQIRTIFLVGTVETPLEKEKLNKLLQLEQQESNDILQWDFTDTFYNLTLKQILFFEWLETNCPRTRFVLNGDDDVFANTDNMVEFLQNLQSNGTNKHLFTGNLMVYSPAIREYHSRYFVSEKVFKEDYFPPYCSGGGFLLSGYTASIIYKMSQSIPLIPLDDAYMGMCLAKAGLSPSSHMGVQPYGLRIPSKLLDQYDPCFFKDKLLVHGFRSVNMYVMWKRVHEPHLKCSSSKKLPNAPFKW